MDNMLANYSTKNENTFEVNTSQPSNGSLETNSSHCDNVTISEYQFSLIPVVYSLIFIIGFTGNSIVVTILYKCIGLKTVASIYIFNLAIADLVCLASLPLWAVYYALNYDWIFGSVMCKICGFLFPLNIYASIFFITCMSMDRYLAIVYPFLSQRRRNVCQARFVSVAVWLLACCSSIPAIYFRETRYLENLRVTACIMNLPEENNVWFAGLALMKNTLGFLIPLTMMGICYIRIGVHLMKPQALENNRNQNRDHILLMLIAVVVVFFTCWLPFHILTFLDALISINVITSCDLKNTIDPLLMYAICLALSNSCINPFLYYFIGKDFKTEFRRLSSDKMASSLGSRRSSTTRYSSFSRKGSDARDAVIHANCIKVGES
ncbi:type-2 angiotensin II receptor [Protopterus annectens]|uniref:type-2 angiotensin II receptor n=1 Tax=Protopterus annectens TaxID=7888 RepID=UPI001CF9F5F4|nr:type-2 angiotensin II receptor [Protopterus annectens]